jgi:hypothetical protein
VHGYTGPKRGSNVLVAIFALSIGGRPVAEPHTLVGRTPAGSVVRILAIEDSHRNFWAPDGGPVERKIRSQIFQYPPGMVS